MEKKISRASTRFRRGRIFTSLLIILVLGGVLGGAGYLYFQNSRKSTLFNDLIVAKASKGPFDHIVLEQGELESASNVEVVCDVRARNGAAGTALLWVIDEGTIVKKGDKLVELDSSALETSLNEKKIEVIAAQSAVAAAKALVEQAVISRQEYLEGLFQNEERLIQSEIAIAEQGLRKAQLALQSTERLVAKGLVKSLQLEADQFAVANNRNLLDTAQNRLRVLQNLTRQKMLVQFDSAIDAAQAQLDAATAALDEEEGDLRFFEKQISLCNINAPADGVAIHANSYSSRGGSAEFVVEPGAIIRERQTILRLPDPKKMQVRATVNESRITLIRPGMPAKIRIDAVSGTELLGRVGKVNRYAEPGSWMSSSIKEYAATVEIINPPESIRTGMTAEVQIFVEQIPEATQIPIQAVYEHGGKTYSLVRRSPTDFETREVVLGATNEKLATIGRGIEAGESVVLNLRQNLSLLDLPEIEQEDNTAMASLSTVDASAEAVDGPSSGREPEGGKRPGGYGGPGANAVGGGAAYGGRPGAPGGSRPGGPPAGAGRGQDGGGRTGSEQPRGEPRRDAAQTNNSAPTTEVSLNAAPETIASTPEPSTASRSVGTSGSEGSE